MNTGAIQSLTRVNNVFKKKKKKKGLLLKYAEKWETHVFHIYFLNMDISLLMKLTLIKIAIHVAEIHW